MIHLTRKETFSAAHRMFRKDWTIEKNSKIFGKCANLHGHDYSIFITVKGNVKETGYIVDLKMLSKIIHKNVIEKCDHKNLEEFMKGILPSGENICVAIWNELNNPINALGCTLHSVKVCETDKNIAEFFGD